ncbi:proline and serine-rich protein 2-like [Megalops cyprinoides]|uniref:proline and serine-rich protein 2-like n=1 Tax=Megalops cyprinoides TaxID=118141 RepID=UPI00186500DD|nr:proline and serine-rich protein 2-like [Megalops cyprinoides]XP_036373892.1 proline and serine-rich protein 2-like [Megalops cyprinoides]
MPRSSCALDTLAMDFHLPPDPRLRYGINGSQESPRRNSQNRRPFEDEALQFLSLEEKECILFFEETIDSLDDDMEDAGLGLSSGSSTSAEGRSATPSPDPVTDMALGPARSPSPKEQDIIDLVRSQPDPPEPREGLFSQTMPDFQSMVVNPESHFEMKARREPMENFPAEYHLSPPSAPSAPMGESGSVGYSLYQPAGSIPTPVLIAQKIAEHQGGFLSGRRRSLDSQTSPPPTPEQPVKQGPPTMAKPTRFPDNISLMMSSRDYNQTIAKAAVNVQERKARMLANLTGQAVSIESEEAATASSPTRNIPTRSVSFRDPAPDKSRMEALSKLGLTQSQGVPGANGGWSRVIRPTQASTTKPETFSTGISSYDIKPHTTQSSATTTQTEVPTIDFNSYGGKSKVVNPASLSAAKTDTASHHHDTKSNVVSQPSYTETTSSDFNSYGGKTKVMTPLSSPGTRRNAASHHNSNYDSRPSGIVKTEASSSDFNTYGGKTKVMTPAPVSTAKTESSSDSFISHDTKPKLMAFSPPASAKTEGFSNDFNTYGGKSKVITPLVMSHSKPEAAASDSNIPVVTPRPAAALPTVTPKPASSRVEPRHAEAPRLPRRESAPASHGATAAPPLPDVRRRSGSKPSLFHQGITVQFSGRGATDESRREALRKLGLLKDTP